MHARPAASINWRWVLMGGLALATLDALFATGYWRLTAGVPWTRVFQTVAAGVLGLEASVAGGIRTAWLGVGLHYLIAMAFVVAYTLAALRVGALRRHPLASGLGYGLLLYATMNLVVIPLSAIGHLPKFDNLPWVAASIAMHAVFGLICAGAALRALAPLSARLPAPSAR
ncbi:MAG TPA: hypothetical protein VLM17_02450 [Xanthomonadaceae bacterium]|nr:hypothetical protein [Xanthomonadaceae bacterium]